MSKHNPLLDDLDLPGISVSLPSMGQWYKPGVLAEDVNPGEIMVGPYSLPIEMTFNDPYKILSGKAFSDLLSHVTTGIEQPNELLMIDAEVLMVAARIASHGKESEVAITCSNVPEGKEEPCGAKDTVRVDLEAILAMYEPGVVGSPEDWQVKMANDQIVQLGPLKYSDAIDAAKLGSSIMRDVRFLENNDKMELDNLQEKMFQTAYDMNRKIILDMIFWVSTKTGERVYDRDVIETWLSKIPTFMMDPVSDKIAEVTKRLEYLGKVKYQCSKCKAEQPVSVISDPQRFFGKGSTAAKAENKS